MKKKTATFFCVCAILFAVFGVAYHMCVVERHEQEIKEWQEAVLPVYTSRTNARVDPGDITPAGVSNMLNPCHAVAYREMDRWSWRGCDSFAEPIAPVIVTVRFADPMWEEPIQRGL